MVEQGGRIAVITNLANPTRAVFLDISSRVVGGVPGDERGLLGLAFHPQFRDNQRFFAQFAVDAKSYLDMYPEMVLPEDVQAVAPSGLLASRARACRSTIGSLST